MRSQPHGTRRAPFPRQLCGGPQPEPCNGHRLPVHDGEAFLVRKLAHGIGRGLHGGLPVFGLERDGGDRPGVRTVGLTLRQLRRQPSDLGEVALGPFEVAGHPVQPDPRLERPRTPPVGLDEADGVVEDGTGVVETSQVHEHFGLVGGGRRGEERPLQPDLPHRGPVLRGGVGGLLEAAHGEEVVHPIVRQAGEVLVVFAVLEEPR